MPEAQATTALPLLLALELPPQARLNPLSLTRDAATELASRIAHDLAELIPAVKETRLAMAGAWFDTCELLRPGFPIWSTLDELARRVPRGQLENVVAFGSHEGRMPAQLLEPDPTYAAGPLRLLPLSLLVPQTLAKALDEQLEQALIGRGEAGSATADWLIRQLAIPLEHARYLSRNDLIALTCIQYEHVNLAPLWNLLEAALLTPYREEAALSARGLAWRYAQGRVTVQSLHDWLAAQSGVPPQERRHAIAGALFELRQYAALLEAHGLPLALDARSAAADSGWLLEPLAEPQETLSLPRLYAHRAPGLGIIALTVAQQAGNKPHLLAHGYPLIPDSLLSLTDALAERYRAPAKWVELDEICLDEDGKLSVPSNRLN